MATATMTRNWFDLNQVVEESRQREHICATCANKERVSLLSPNGGQSAAVWRCRELTVRFQQEIIVEPTGTCFGAKSLSDYWQQSDETNLVW